jgi:ABC-type lipoprotein export system ATPase subunit
VKANESVLLTAEEPTENLESDIIEERPEILRLLNIEYRITIILVTHDNQVIQAASKTLCMLDEQLYSDFSR